MSALNRVKGKMAAAPLLREAPASAVSTDAVRFG